MMTDDFINLHNLVVHNLKNLNPDELEIQIELKNGVIIAEDATRLQLTDFGCYIIAEDEIKAHFFTEPKSIAFIPMHESVAEFMNADGEEKELTMGKKLQQPKSIIDLGGKYDK